MEEDGEMAFDPIFSAFEWSLKSRREAVLGRFWEPLCGASERSCDISPKGSLWGSQTRPRILGGSFSPYIFGVAHRDGAIKAFHGGTATSTLGTNMSRDFQKLSLGAWA